MLRGSAGRGLAENHLRPAGQPGGHRAKIIAAGQRNTRQLSGQRLFDQRRAGAAAGKIDHIRGGLAAVERERTCSIMRVRG